MHLLSEKSQSVKVLDNMVLTIRHSGKAKTMETKKNNGLQGAWGREEGMNT